MLNRLHVVEVACDEVRQALVEYMDGDMPQALPAEIAAHLQNCAHCTAIYDGVRNLVVLLGAQGNFELPEGFSQRLYRKLRPRLGEAREW